MFQIQRSSMGACYPHLPTMYDLTSEDLEEPGLPDLLNASALLSNLGIQFWTMRGLEHENDIFGNLEAFRFVKCTIIKLNN
ncbi:MAG: hypothetical protein AAGA60_28250 [Cyanobacteria bacterium P01_E01_bin.42]